MIAAAAVARVPAFASSAHAATFLKSASGCAVNITAGTETGHAGGTCSHRNGCKVDLSMYTCVGNYIENTFTDVGCISGWGYQRKSGAGNLHTDEGVPLG
ncbi:hypothetical protein QEZ54_21040 [Catellatospora sp. KI3]|uniref:hypothetical protein n=1 Tax=Catellatospora sp. KI3 TaxID=3041620 RepID=UPI00248328CD|nr:hypothetical protein [Catellatospora sp. KI3]MDI1463472.1 hypothetical protein [Catellatospora sp. KI3]